MLKLADVSEVRTSSILRDRSRIFAYKDITNFYILLHTEMPLHRLSITLVKMLQTLNVIALNFFSLLDFARLFFPNDN
jgi:hypothetical protein